jgi:hypothetical protein
MIHSEIDMRSVMFGVVDKRSNLGYRIGKLVADWL